ncbi:MAG: nitrilase-related carbon-nitrogen hydrolase [Limisphaerales bacterium]
MRWLPFLKWFTPITGGYAAGEFPSEFKIHGWGERPREPQIELDNGSSVASPRQSVHVAPLICFEDMFPQTARASVKDDTDFLVNLTNDGWFGEGAEQWQQAAAGVFRAVENGVPLVRSCNNGVTCWIDAHGQLRQIFKDQTGGIYGIGAMTFELPLPDEKPAPTFYNRHGDWFGWGCVGVASLIFVRKITKRKNATI